MGRCPAYSFSHVLGLLHDRGKVKFGVVLRILTSHLKNNPPVFGGHGMVISRENAVALVLGTSDDYFHGILPTHFNHGKPLNSGDIRQSLRTSSIGTSVTLIVG